MVMEASRAEYLANDKFKSQVGQKNYPLRPLDRHRLELVRRSSSETKLEESKEQCLQDSVLSSDMQLLLSMGFSYLQANEAYSIETGSSSRSKGKATDLIIIDRCPKSSTAVWARFFGMTPGL
ncbi:hypothetical protein V6N13_039399 [Hibiscus sabdariffa]